MDNQMIFDVLKSKHVTEQPYEVFLTDDTCYFGKDFENNVVFMIPSLLKCVASINQETRSLRFAFNKKCTFRHNDETDTKIVHLLTCKEKEDEKIKAFIRLTRAFAQTERDNDQLYLSKLFSSISALFDRQKQVSEMELQGLFAELFVILHFSEIGCDISSKWQSRNMMKFDFSISEKKRIEIKSTLKSSRTHHFKHEQLRSEMYDIKIVSMMLRKSDYGLSLKDIVEKLQDMYADNYTLLLHIESMIAHVSGDDLESIKYDVIHLKENLRYYDAKEIPHFNEKTPEGVFNAEYDCCLDTSTAMSENEVVNWIKED